MSQGINTIISQLAEIDSASAKIMQETQVEKNKYSEMITSKRQQFDDEIDAKVEAEVSEYKETVLKENEELLAQSKKECAESIEALEKNFEENGDAWATEIFNNIIKE